MSPKAARNCSAAIWAVSAVLLLVLAMFFTPVLMLRAVLAAARAGFGAGLAAGLLALDTGVDAGWFLRTVAGFFAGLVPVADFTSALAAGFFFSVLAAALGAG